MMKVEQLEGWVSVEPDKTISDIALDHAFEYKIDGITSLSAYQRGIYTDAFLAGVAYKFTGE